MLYPPSTIKLIPVIQLDLLLNKNSIAFVISLNSPNPNGCWLITFSKNSLVICLEYFDNIGLFIIPGEIELTLILYLLMAYT